MSEKYLSGSASLFSSLARDVAVVVACPGCRSDDTKPVDLEFDMYECTNCGAVFTRQPHQDNGNQHSVPAS